MKSSLVAWLPAAVASGLIACGASTSSKKTNDHDAGDDAAALGAGGKKGTGGGSAAGATGAGGATTTGGASGAGGTSVSEAGPDAPSVDASADASTEACNPTLGDQTPPTVVSATKIADDQIALTFSEPVKMPIDVDPTKFRLSVGYTQNFESPQDVTTYEDPSSASIDADFSVVSLSGDCTDTLVVTFASSVGNSVICSGLDFVTSEFGGHDAGLFLHFTDAKSPTIEDLNGNDFASAGAAWVTAPDGDPLPSSLQLTGHYPDNPIRVTVPCTVPDGG